MFIRTMSTLQVHYYHLCEKIYMHQKLVRQVQSGSINNRRWFHKIPAFHGGIFLGTALSNMNNLYLRCSIYLL